MFILFDNVIFFFISLFMCAAAAQWSEKGRICPGLPSFQKWMDDVIKAIEIAPDLERRKKPKNEKGSRRRKITDRKRKRDV